MNPSEWPLEDLWLSLRDIHPGISVECLPEVDSTNTELGRRVRQGHSDAVLLAAVRQTAGRGRMGKSWLTPADGALTFSIGLPLNPAHLPGITMNLALAKRMAGLIEQMKLSPADEAAPVYLPRKTP